MLHLTKVFCIKKGILDVCDKEHQGGIEKWGENIFKGVFFFVFTNIQLTKKISFLQCCLYFDTMLRYIAG